MALSAAQITDLEQIIMTPIDMIGNTASKHLLIDYLINSTDALMDATDAKLKKVLADPEAKDALEDILEQKYLVADLWLENKIFLGKGEKGQAEPTREEIANIMFQKLIKESNLSAHDKQHLYPNSETIKKRSFIYQALVNGQITDLTIVPDGTTEEKTAQAKKKAADRKLEQTYQQENQTIQQLLDAAYLGDTGYLKQTIQSGFNINKTYPPYGGTLLSYAVTGGQLEVVNYLLDDLNADPNITDHNNNLPLQWAVLKLNPENQSARTNTRTPTRTTLDTKQLDIIESLLNAGSKVNVKDKQNQSPIDILTQISKANSQNPYEDMSINEITIRNNSNEKFNNIFEKTQTFSNLSQNLNSQIETIQRLITYEKPSTIINRFPNEILLIIRSSYSLNDLLVHKFRTPDNESLTLLEWAIQHKALTIIKQCIQSCPTIIQRVSQGQYTSPLTFALEQAFKARYTNKDEYLKIAEYFLMKGAKAGVRDREIIESFYPDIPEDILKLTNFKTEFEGLNAKSSRYDAEQAQKNVFDRTGIRFEIVKLTGGFGLRHQEAFSPMSLDSRGQKIQNAYGNDLGIQEKSRGIGMGWGEVTLTIPSQIIPQICHNDFSVLLRQQGKAKQLEQKIYTKQAEEQAKARAIRTATKELNLSRTKVSATQAYEKLNAIMLNQWQLVPTQEGYELQYDIGFSEEKEKFDRSRFHTVIDSLLGFEVQEKRVATSRGSAFYQLVVTPADLQKLNIKNKGNINETLDFFWPKNPNDKPNLYLVLKLIELNPTLKENPFAYKGATPLSLAVAEADVDSVNKLLALGVTIDNKDDKEDTELQQAILKTVPGFQDPDFSPEKRERYKQIALLLVRKGANINSMNYSLQSCKQLLQQHCPLWLPEIEKELKNLSIFSPSSVSSTRKQKTHVDKDTAVQLLQQHKPTLLEFQQVLLSATPSLFKCDYAYVPNIIGALETIADDKRLMAAVIEQEKLNFKSLSSDPHQFLQHIFEFKISSEKKTCFEEMIDYYCIHKPLLKKTLDQFREAVITTQTSSLSTTASSSSSLSSSSIPTSSNSLTNSRTPSHDTHIENLVDTWQIAQAGQNAGLNTVSSRLDALKQECTNEINALKTNFNAPHEKTGNIAKTVALIDALVKALNEEKNGNQNNEKIKELVQDFREETFTLGERFYIAVISFLDSVLSAILPTNSSTEEEKSRFKFFKPFEEDKLKQECLEFSEVLNLPEKTSLNA